MKFEIIGSGGCVALPKPLCKCQVCSEAREKGRPYSRYGPSLFLHDLNMLIDTPEDIVQSLNDSQVDKIDYVLYSHMDPDHVLGFRVFEHLRLNWFDVFENKKCTDPIKVLSMPHVMKDLQEIKSKYGSYLDYYDKVRNLIDRESVETFKEIKGVKVHFVKSGGATIFIFEKNDKKLIYAPCDVKPFPKSDLYLGADVLLIGNSFIGDTLKGGYELPKDNLLRKELFSLDEIQTIRQTYDIKEVIMTHLEEDWGKSYDDYKKLEEKLDHITFAYDGLMIEV